MSSRDPLEGKIQGLILRAVGALPDFVVMRNANVALKYYDEREGREKFLRGGLGDGSADLIGILSLSVLLTRPDGSQVCQTTGRFVALEVKKPGGRVEPEQEAWLEAVRRAGGFAAVVHSPEEALAALDRARRGETS